MTRPHVVLASHELAPLVQAGGVGRHVCHAARLLAPVADVTVVLPSGMRARYERETAGGASILPDGVALHIAAADQEQRARFVSPFHADAAEVAAVVAEVRAQRPVDLVEVDDYLGLGAVLVDAAAGGEAPRLAVRLHTTWEMTQVLDGRPLTGADARWLCALERRGLRAADLLVAPGAAARDVYARFYGSAALAPMTVLEPAPPAVAPDAAGPPEDRGGPLRLLFAGRLEERKGVRALVEAVVGSDLDVVLRLAGGDTDTAPGGGSMREHLEQLVAGDPRVTFAGRLDPEALAEAYADAQLVVLPSRFESFGYVLREALAQGRPVLATPTAGFLTPMADPRAGWLADGFDAEALAAGLRHVVAERGRLDELLADAAPRAVLGDGNADAWVAAMLGLVPARGAGRATAAAPPERCTAVVLALGGDLERSLTSLAAQDPSPEVVVVSRSASRVPAALLELVDELVLCPPGQAVDRALAVRSGSGPVLVLHAGETLLPGGLARLGAALASPRGPVFATAWAAGCEGPARPIGGPEARLVADFGAGGSAALLTAEAALAAAADGVDPVAALVRRGADGIVVADELLGIPRRRPLPDHDEAAGLAVSAVAAQHELWSAQPAQAAAQEAPEHRDA